MPLSRTLCGCLRVALAAVALAGCAENQTHPMREPYRPGDPTPLGCLPDLDGRIESEEIAGVPGIPVSYVVSPAGVERPVDVAGRIDADGRRVWDLSLDYADDQLARLSASELEGQWFASSFPGGEIVAPSDAGATILGVYRQDDSALWLMGLASAEPDPPEGRTLLVYETPVALYRFPIEPGSEHTEAAEIRDGMLRGLPYAGRDVYEVRADAAGRLELPDLIFEQAQRVRVRVTVEPAVGSPTSRRQVSWLFECFGEVARATSRADEPDEDFTTAAELRRLSLE